MALLLICRNWYTVFTGIMNGGLTRVVPQIELKHKYKYRLILDETFSFGTVGRTGRGLTELYNVPASEVDMLIGSVATSLCSAGGFCAGSSVVVKHQVSASPVHRLIALSSLVSSVSTELPSFSPPPCRPLSL